jgi:molecular chaperone DnaK
MSDGSAAGRVFGIDLGTTYSAIAHLDETGRPTVCRNSDNMETTPSVVHFETPDNVVVGQLAKDSAVLDPDNVVSLIKRQMGEDFPQSFHGADQTPESISSFILRALAADAENQTGAPVDKVVITVPAYFGAKQKDATLKAGLIAGLDVIGVVPEPVAAALYYGTTAGSDDRTVLVYDLGGGTFDTTVIKVGAEEITVLVTDGATDLGGADWDAQLSALLLERFTATADVPGSPEDDPEFMQKLAGEAEGLKKALSKRESRPVSLAFGGAAARIEVSRADFEARTVNLLDRSIEIVRRTLAKLEDKVPGTKIDEVLLVGGSTHMPVVAERLVAEFGWSPKLQDPDLAVAKGAAVFALSRVMWRMQQDALEQAGSQAEGAAAAAKVVQEVARQFGMSETVAVELAKRKPTSVLSKAFGVRVQRSAADTTEYVKHLAFADDALPTGPRTMTGHTLYPEQTSVEIALYEQAGTVASEDLSANNPLTDGAGVIQDIPPQTPAEFAIAPRAVDIVMEINDDGLLELSATERSTGQELQIAVKVGLSAEAVDQAKAASSKISVSN